MARRDRNDFELGDYIEVADRLAKFYELHPEGRVSCSPPIVVMIEGDTGKHWEHQPDPESGELQLRLVDGPDPEGSTYVKHQTYVQVTATVWRTPDDPTPCQASAWELFPGKTPYTRESEMMNAETSAVGRALWTLGIEARKGAASREDVEKARASNEPEDRGRPLTRQRQQSRAPKSDPPAPGMATKAQVSMMAALFGGAGVTDRDQRLAIIARQVGREVASSKDLTKAEASALIEWAKQQGKGITDG